MELWDILDENGDKTGRTIERGKPMRQDEYHLVVHVWIRNKKGEYLISKRTPNKTFPDMWDTTGGSAITGDNSLQAALREVKEEIGIDLNPENGRCLFRIKRQTYNSPDFLDVWLFDHETDISNLIFQPEEVNDAMWANENLILGMIRKGEFVDVYNYIDRVFETT